MLFIERLTELRNILQPEMDRLLALALENSAHDNDLLLWFVHGFYNPQILIWNENHPDNILNPHCIGFGKEGLSEHDHYKFIHNYRTQFTTDKTRAEYSELVTHRVDDKEHNQLKDRYIEQEQELIQIEMLIYLKIWESDMFINRFYQLVRILSGEHYDWYFKVCSSNRDEECTGNRQELVRLQTIKSVETVLICDTL